MWAFIGHLEKDVQGGTSKVKQYLYTHSHFEIHYNGDNVIEVAVSPDEQKSLDISEDAVGEAASLSVEFSYSVSWHETPVPFAKRLDHYHQFSMNPVHLEVRSPPPPPPHIQPCTLPHTAFIPGSKQQHMWHPNSSGFTCRCKPRRARSQAVSHSRQCARLWHMHDHRACRSTGSPS